VDVLSFFVDLLANFDSHLRHWLQTHGAWAIAILALIVFAETGLVVFPFLPGDSMLFIVGVFCGAGLMDGWLVAPVLVAAAIAGDALNYGIGRGCGQALMQRLAMVRRGHEYSHRWFERHGPRTIVIARFVPLLRTFAPFAAGFGKMSWAVFTRWNIVGAVLWVGSLMGLGWMFGDLPLIRDNLSKAILAIVVISLLPLLLPRRSAKPVR
jgi:membrane-associated protein